jgi:hypothetical protein
MIVASPACLPAVRTSSSQRGLPFIIDEIEDSEDYLPPLWCCPNCMELVVGAIHRDACSVISGWLEVSVSVHGIQSYVELCSFKWCEVKEVKRQTGPYTLVLVF